MVTRSFKINKLKSVVAPLIRLDIFIIKIMIENLFTYFYILYDYMNFFLELFPKNFLVF